MADLGITLEIAAQRLTEYLTAEKRVLAKQSYEIGDRKLTLADLGEIRQGIVFWDGRVTALGGATVRTVGRVRRGSYRSR